MPIGYVVLCCVVLCCVVLCCVVLCCVVLCCVVLCCVVLCCVMLYVIIFFSLPAPLLESLALPQCSRLQGAALLRVPATCPQLRCCLHTNVVPFDTGQP